MPHLLYLALKAVGIIVFLGLLLDEVERDYADRGRMRKLKIFESDSEFLENLANGGR